MGSWVGLSVPVNPPSFVVALEPPCLTSGKLKLIFPLWVARANERRGWLGGFLQEVPYSLCQVIQAVAHQLTKEIAHHKSGMEEWDLHHPCLLTSGKRFAGLWFGANLSPANIWFQIPLSGHTALYFMRNAV